MRLARICLVPRHAHGESPDEELSKAHVLTFRSQQQVEVDEAGIGRFGCMDRDRVLLFQDHGSVRRDEFNQRAP